MNDITRERAAFAEWLGRQHLRFDSRLTQVIYLPSGSPEDEVRLLEVNTGLYPIQGEPIAPLETTPAVRDLPFRVMVADITPEEWKQLQTNPGLLPAGMESGREDDHREGSMNARQVAFYRQARSDWAVFCHFHPLESRWMIRLRRFWCGMVGVRPFSFPPCHPLHYLQMCTEKLAKAYYQTMPRSSHAAFRRFLTDLPSNPKAVTPLGFADLAGLTRWQASVSAIVGAIEDLAPTIAEPKHLPNPEYPWPRGAEVHAPVDHSFHPEIFSLLCAQAGSGEPPFLRVLGRMLGTVQVDGWHL